MRILGIESSSLVASAAIYEDGITMAEYTVDIHFGISSSARISSSHCKVLILKSIVRDALE